MMADILSTIKEVRDRAKQQRERDEERRREHDFSCPIKPGKDVVYHISYGSWYDRATGEWLRPKCPVPDCKWCSDRPERMPPWKD